MTGYLFKRFTQIGVAMDETLYRLEELIVGAPFARFRGKQDDSVSQQIVVWGIGYERDTRYLKRIRFRSIAIEETDEGRLP